MKSIELTRRQFLKGTGALVVSFNLFPSLSSPVFGQTTVGPGIEADPSLLDSWLAIAPDGTVTVFSGKVDLGTGVETALAQIVAEELDVPFNHVHMIGLDTTKAINQGTTAASRTIERGGPQLRQAAAAARQELLKLASVQLGVPAEKLTVEDGVVTVMGAPAKKTSYGSLVGGKRFDVKITATGTGWDLKVAPDIRAKDPRQYKIVGTSVPRVDLPKKFTGEFTYTQDVRVPGMLHGRVVRPPVAHASASSVDNSAAKAIPGVKRIVQEGGFVGVVADNEWSAIQAARVLKVTWSAPGTAFPSGPEQIYKYLETKKSYKDQMVTSRGDVESALRGASKTIEATYRWPFQLHGMIGPSCAVADVQPEKTIIWAGSQGPFYTRKRIAELLNLPEQQVQVVYREGPGSYGRLESDDAAEDAALLSRAVGKPVRVQWMREDEHAWEPKGPAHLIKIRAGVDAQGKIVAWYFEDRTFPWTETLGNPMLA